MIKKMKSLGKTLTKQQQKEVNGGFGFGSSCRRASECQFIFGPHINPTGDYSCSLRAPGADPANGRGVCVSNT